MDDSTDFFRTLPSSPEAEQAFLGCVLFEPTAIDDLALDLQPGHFYEPFHGRLWGAIQSARASAIRPDVMVLREQFRRDPAFIDLGGLRYLADLMDRAPPAVHAPDYAKVIHKLALRRQIIALAHDMVEWANDAAIDPEDALAKSRMDMEALELSVEPDDASLTDARTAAYQAMDEIEEESAHGKPKGKMTGLRCIDWRLRGLRPGHLIIIAGRPGMMKTGLARVAAEGCASRNPQDLVAFFALEMDRRELAERSLSAASFLTHNRIPYQELSGGTVDPMTIREIRDEVWKIPKNLVVDDTSTLSLEHIKRRCRALKRKGNLVAVFIDYLQIMEMAEVNGENLASRIGKVTAGLKRLARQLGICIVLLSQVNRGVESRDDKRPQLSDLRESGAIEQDANAVLFPFREVYYLERSSPKEGTPEHLKWEQECELLKLRMDVICGKNRGGAVGSDRQEVHPAYDVIRDLHGE